MTGLHCRGQLLADALGLESMMWFRVAQILRGEDRSLGSDPPSISDARGRKRGSAFVWYVSELLLTPEPGPLPQNIEVEKCCYLFLGCFVGVHMVERCCLSLRGLLRDHHGDRCWHEWLGCMRATVEVYGHVLRRYGS